MKNRNGFTLLLILFFTLNANAQQNDVVFFENNNIAIKKQNDSVYFYNCSGELRKIIDLKNKKSISFGLPKEVQDIIYNGMIRGIYIRVSEETFPTYLYTQRYLDVGEVTCSEHAFYNEFGLKTGYEEECPNDMIGIGKDSYVTRRKNAYKYNKYGLLIEVEYRNRFYKYNNNGQLIEVYYKRESSGEIFLRRKYKYKENKLIECIIDPSPLYRKSVKINYIYNDKGLLSEIINGEYREKILIEYNDQGKVVKLSEMRIGAEYKKTYFTYHYDSKNRIERIQVNHRNPEADFFYTYDIKGNLIQITNKGEIEQSLEYNDQGTLINIKGSQGYDKAKLKY